MASWKVEIHPIADILKKGEKRSNKNRKNNAQIRTPIEKKISDKKNNSDW